MPTISIMLIAEAWSKFILRGRFCKDKLRYRLQFYDCGYVVAKMHIISRIVRIHPHVTNL